MKTNSRSKPKVRRNVYEVAVKFVDDTNGGMPYYKYWNHFSTLTAAVKALSKYASQPVDAIIYHSKTTETGIQRMKEFCRVGVGGTKSVDFNAP